MNTRLAPTPRTASATTARADAAIPSTHPFAVHLGRVAARREAAPHPFWTPDDGPLPSLYISHGAPPLFENGEWMTELHDWARALPRPRAILIVSAHWESNQLGITSTVPSGLVYDFGGFDPLYYTMRYDTPEASDLARRLAAVMPDTEALYEHRNRGLDHGAWVPLKTMYPEADIPVLQLSLPVSADTDHLVRLGERLRGLREQGVLVIGSGFMTHGLPFINWHRPEEVPTWSSEFDAWAAEALDRGDVHELQRYRTHAPGMPYAHPTVEHFTPLFVALGAATDPTAPPTTVIDGYSIGLAKRSFQAA